MIFLNQDDLNDFSHWRIVDLSKAVVLGGIGVDLDEWPFTPPVSDPIRFLFIGRLLREKGIEQFVAGARLVKKLYPEVEFVVLGDVDSNPGGIHKAQMQAWVDAGILTWPGHVAVVPWLERSSVFVLPSYYRKAFRVARKRRWQWVVQSLLRMPLVAATQLRMA